jgi:hypothetical protein
MIAAECQPQYVMIWLILSMPMQEFRCLGFYISRMKALSPILLIFLLSCSTRPAAEQPEAATEQTEAAAEDSVGRGASPTELDTEEGTNPDDNFIPQMTLEDHTVSVMLKGVDMNFNFPAGGEAIEKREDGFGFTYPGQPGTNLNMRSYRFTAHSPPCDIQDFEGEEERGSKTIGDNTYTIKSISQGGAGSIYSTFMYYFERGDICFQFFLDLKSTSPGLVEGVTVYDENKELAEFEAMLAKLEMMEPGN